MRIQLHQNQNKVLTSVMQNRKTVLVAGRRFGKSRLGIYTLVLKALGFKGTVSAESPETVLAVMPTAVQARRIIWKPLLSYVQREPFLLSRLESFNKSEMMLTFKGKPSIRVAGANDADGDSLRGIRCYYLYADEYQDWKPSIYPTVLKPAMADTLGSSELKTGTPKGILNHLYVEYQNSTNVYHFKTLDNPFISREEIENARQNTHPRLFRQEYEASFEEYAAKVFTELDASCRVRCSHNDYNLVVAGVDWGDKNPAVVIVARYDGCWYCIDHWENTSGLVLPTAEIYSNIKRLCNKYNVTLALCDPSRPSSIMDLRKIGIPAKNGYNRIEEGLSQLNNLFYQKKLHLLPDRVFDTAMAYHRATSKDGEILERIEEGQDDHLVDALRYAMAIP